MFADRAHGPRHMRMLDREGRKNMVVNGRIEYSGENAGAVRNETVRNRTTICRGKAGRGEILGALVEALGKVKKLTKSDRNESEGYTFTSIDSFLSLVNPICAETGLVVLMDETSVEDVSAVARSGTDAWLRISYEFTLAHVSGQTLGPFRRHVDVPRSGPQAYGAAQSYVLKQFLRAQFQIATGETDDPDFGTRAKDGSPFDQSAARNNPASSEGQKQADALDDGVVRQLAQRIVDARSGRELLAIFGGLSDECQVNEKLAVARVTALRRIVGTARNLAALDMLQQHFSPDWSKVQKVAERRRQELANQADDSENTAGADVLTGSAHPTDRQTANAVIKEAGNPALLVVNADTPEHDNFGDIPYSEAAA